MNRALLLLLLLTALLLGSCATMKPVDKLTLLRAELARWQNFSADGIIRVTYAGLTLHKMFVLAKTVDSARLDVVDGGAFGISPAPLISVFLADYLAVESSYLKLPDFSKSQLDPSPYLALLADPEALLAKYGEEIAANAAVDVGDLRVTFTPQMQLAKVEDVTSRVALSVTYGSKGDPDEVLIRIDNSKGVELLVDNISYGGAETVPLPRPDQATKEGSESLSGSSEQP